eukprot:4466026-Pleurochrysis_carterae.AAC.1
MPHIHKALLPLSTRFLLRRLSKRKPSAQIVILKDLATALSQVACNLQLHDRRDLAPAKIWTKGVDQISQCSFIRNEACGPYKLLPSSTLLTWCEVYQNEHLQLQLARVCVKGLCMHVRAVRG